MPFGLWGWGREHDNTPLHGGKRGKAKRRSANKQARAARRRSSR